MRKFREFLKEIELLHSPKSEYDDTDLGYHPRSSKYMSTTKSGHEIYSKKLKHDYADFSAYNPKTKKVDLSIAGKLKQHKNKEKVLSDLHTQGREGSTLKAHELYHHLITHHNMILQSDKRQSTGGLKIWKKLHKMPGIHVHGYDSRGGRHISRVGLGYTHSKDNNPLADENKRHLTLVAHKENK